LDEPPVPTLSHYRLIEKIGEGGMGVVWKAEDTILSRTVAIKILPADVSRDETRRTMFLDEARAASAASHAHVVQVHEFGHERGLDFIVMEYVEGRPLGRILVGRPLPSDKVAQLGVQIALALQAAHRKGLLHRDLKPSNVLVTPDGEVKVVDFGLASLFAGGDAPDDRTETRTDSDATEPRGPVAGTLPYMSPEQVRGESLDARSDVFSLGIVLYEMATGQRPFEGPTPPELARAIQLAAPKPIHDLVPSVPLDLERIVQKALARRPGERYQTMDDFAVDLKRLDRDLESGSAPSYEALRGAITTPPAPISTPAPAHSLRPPWRSAGIAVAAIAGVAAVGWWLAHSRGPSMDARTVLVLPFEVHGATGDVYLGQALAEAIAVNLTEAQALRLLPVPAAAPSPADALGAGRAAGAGRVLTGSLTRESGVIHISLTLLDAGDGHLVSGVLRDEEHPDLTILAAGIATELAGKMNVTARRAYEYPLYLNGDPKMVASPDAAQALAGWRVGGWRRALDSAARLVHAYPEELGALALYAYMLQQQMDSEPSASRERFDEALRSIERLDPKSPYPAYFRTVNAKIGGRVVEARGGYSSLLARDDLTPACRAWILRNASTLTIREMDNDLWVDAPSGPQAASGDALATDRDNLRKAVTLDPANPWSHLYLSWVLHISGDTGQAITEARKAVALEPGFALPRLTLGSFLGAQGNWQEVPELLQKDCEGNDSEACVLVGTALASLQRSAEARAAIARIPKDIEPDAAVLFRLGRFWLLEGDRAKAKGYLDRAVAKGVPAERLAVEPELAALAGSDAPKR